MALRSLRLRRAYSLIHRSLHQPQPVTSISSHLLSTPISNPNPNPNPSAAAARSTRSFTSTPALFAKRFDPVTDEIGPDTILFEGCDYNHWLITVDFPKDSNLTRDQMIETYVNTAAHVLGSVEEAKKKIYGVCTTIYNGFHVECSEETSNKFYGLPGVVFILPDSYLDPVNKEYGGDKYVNGEIFPRPPPVHYGRRDDRRDDNRDRRRRDNFGPPQQQNSGPPPQQNYGRPSRQNYGPSPQQNYGPPPQQNYGPPPQQNYEPPPQQNYGPPPQQNYGPPPQQNYGPPPQQNYGPPPQQNYGPPPQQNYGPRPQQSYGNSPSSSAQQNYGLPPEQRGFSQGTTGSSQGGSFDQVPGAQKNN